MNDELTAGLLVLLIWDGPDQFAIGAGHKAHIIRAVPIPKINIKSLNVSLMLVFTSKKIDISQSKRS